MIAFCYTYLYRFYKGIKMNNKVFAFTMLMTLSTLLFNPSVWAWDNEVTLRDLTDIAADRSVLSPNGPNFLSKIGFTKDYGEMLLWENHQCDDRTYQTNCKVIDWLKYGAEKEDAKKWVEWEGRFQNHFHNPLSGKGLSDLQTQTQMSCLEWAQSSAAQAAPDTPEGDQSWPTLRQLYREALTTKDETARRAKFAQLFKGLGHQMHLVQVDRHNIWIRINPAGA
jgi:hypothetical protein